MSRGGISYLTDLQVPPGNRPEELAGDRSGQHSIRINQQWRICLRWTGAGPEDVEITDYHKEGREEHGSGHGAAARALLQRLGAVPDQPAVDLEVEKDRLGDELDGIRPLTAVS